MRLLVFLLAAAGLVLAQSSKYTGPRPPKADVPFLKSAGKLIELESGEARQGDGKDGTAYTIPGATSPVRTPVAEPLMLFRSEKINPDRLSLFKMDTKGGQRSIVMPGAKRGKSGPRPIFLMVTRLESGLYRVEVNEYLENGEYCLSPEGSNQVFCFSEY